MIFAILEYRELPALFAVLSANPIIGPVERGRRQDGTVLYDFGTVTAFDDLRLSYTTTTHSPKRFVLPYHERLCSFRVGERTWDKEVSYNIDRPFVMFGLHPCDINALNKLDKVLMESAYPTPYYAAKRENMFVIGMECRPQPQCFCRSMGTDTVLHGFDMFLTDLGDERFFVEVLSATAYEFLRQLNTREPEEADHDRYKDVVAERIGEYSTHVDTTDLTKILDLEFQSDVWDEWGRRCFSCGTCAQVCPTCYCYGVEERIGLDLRHAEKLKHLYACTLLDFAEVAGGHNFRPAASVRLKYRYYHKHRGFVEAFEEPLCVGCGRCGAACLAGITVSGVIASVRGQEQ